MFDDGDEMDSHHSRPNPMDHGETHSLAKTNYGRIGVCACGCTHLTFGQVTLHFPSPEEFARVASRILSEERMRTSDEVFDVNYEWFSMSLTPLGSAEFAHLVNEAMTALAWTTGEMEFTDEDLREIRTRYAS